MEKMIICLVALLALLTSGGCQTSEQIEESHRASVKPQDVSDLLQVDCGTMNGTCIDCVRLEHCRYIKDLNECLANTTRKHHRHSIAFTETDCPPANSTSTTTQRGDPKVGSTDVTTTDPISTETTSGSTTTSTTTEPDVNTTTTTTTTTTTATTDSTTTQANTTTTETTTSTTETTTSATNSTTTTTTSTTTRTAPTTTPDSGRGNRFDGWSFFGGILLSAGVAAILYISYRYYKVRTGGVGPNYNRF